MDTNHSNFGHKTGMSSVEWWTQVVKQTIRLANFTTDEISDNKLDLIAKHLYRLYSTSNCWAIDPDSHHVLSELKKRDTNLKIGVISNNDERLEQILREIGLRHYFDFVLSSRSVGFCKPSKEIFELALNGAKLVDPSLALHIGDDFDLDYLSSKSFGWNALLKRNKLDLSEHQLSQIDGNDIVSDLKQLLDHKLLN